LHFPGFAVVGTYSKIPAPLICDISGLFVLIDPYGLGFLLRIGLDLEKY
jgi:hypothetical protein